MPYYFRKIIEKKNRILLEMKLGYPRSLARTAGLITAVSSFQRLKVCPSRGLPFLGCI